jgi:hypothetical protein
VNAEAWMYEALALAMDHNKRNPEAIKSALGYGGFLAKKSRDVAQLTTAADVLYLRGYYEPFEVQVGKEKELVGVGPLVDLAAQVAPHLPEPHMMSVNLAQKTNDPERMASSIESLLAIGWPNIDEVIRFQARREAEKMAESLRKSDRTAEADKLLAQVTESEGRDVFVRLSWKGDADLDLSVFEPLGATAYHPYRRTVFGGCLVKEGRGELHAEEVYVCPRGFDGDYTIRVATIYNNPDAPVKQATLEVITHEGMAGEHKETRTVVLSKPEPVVAHLSGGRRKEVLPFLAVITVPPKPAKPKKQASPPASTKPGTPAKPATAPKPGPAPKPAPAPLPIDPARPANSKPSAGAR